MSAFFQQCGFGDYRKAWIYTMGHTSKQLMKGLKIENVIRMAISFTTAAALKIHILGVHEDVPKRPQV